MYRAVALHLLRAGLTSVREDELADAERVGEALDSFRLEMLPEGDQLRTMVNREDVTEMIRTPEVGLMASRASRLHVVRERIVDLQRQVVIAMTKDGRGVVVEGRDIGTVVFPDADLKVYMDASAEVRARRRQVDLHQTGKHISLDDVLAEIRSRDKRDATRDHSPLRRADDALLVDTTRTTFDEQVNLIVEQVTAPTRLGRPGAGVSQEQDQRSDQ